MSWMISNGNLPEQENNIKAGSYYIHSTENDFLQKFEDDIFIAIDGYVLPRHKYFADYASYNQHELIYRLYKKKLKDFIHTVKGNFNIVIIHNSFIFIYNDRHSLKKFFYSQTENNFMISGDLATLKKMGKMNFEMDKTAAGVFCVMEHFIGGKSLFEGVHFSKPAAFVHYNGSQLQEGIYWDAIELLDLPEEKQTIEEIAIEFSSLTGEYVEYLKPEGISVTVTGGNDSRFVLAALLHNGRKPAAFTFGSPRSRDVAIARQISEQSGLDYHNYDFENITADLFRDRAEEIIGFGDTMVNIHRAHRLDAAIREKKNHPKNNMILGGFMGGEYTKGVTFDNYIIPAFLKDAHKKGRQELEKQLARILKERFFRFDAAMLKDIIDFIGQEKLLQQMPKARLDLLYAYKLYAVAHHTQDPAVFASRFQYSVNPFMDIDFMEMIFRSKFSLRYNYLDPSFKSKLFVLGTDYLAPDLSDIPYGKKGGYTAREMKAGILPYYLKRIPRYFNKQKFPPNFPYGDWMKEYCLNEVKSLKHSELFDIDKAGENLRNNHHHFTEGYWHRYTNMINLLKNHRHYEG